MKTETIEYKDGDVTLRGYLAYDETKSGKRPGILVMPEALGLGTHAKSRAERLAQLGICRARRRSLRQRAWSYATVEEAIKSATELLCRSRPRRADAGESRSINSHRCRRSIASRLAEIGFCMGGTFGLELARDGAPLQRRGDLSFGIANPESGRAGKVEGEDSRQHRRR